MKKVFRKLTVSEIVLCSLIFFIIAHSIWNIYSLAGNSEEWSPEELLSKCPDFQVGDCFNWSQKLSSPLHYMDVGYCTLNEITAANYGGTLAHLYCPDSNPKDITTDVTDICNYRVAGSYCK